MEACNNCMVVAVPDNATCRPGSQKGTESFVADWGVWWANEDIVIEVVQHIDESLLSEVPLEGVGHRAEDCGR